MEIVGREKEIEYFRNAMERCKAGKGGTYLITGPIGVGKSTLLEEVAKIARQEGFAVLFGRGLDERSVPYLPFTDALSNYKKGEQEPMPLALSLAAEAPEIESLDLVRERGRILESISKRILDIERESPVMLIIDDLQWADSASLSLFLYIARNAQERKLLLLGAYAEEAIKEERNPPFVTTVMQLRSEKIANTLELKPLSYEEVRLLIEKEFGEMPEEIAKVIYQKTEGIPLFVIEVVRNLIDENLYDKSSKALKVPLEQIQIPQTIQSIIKTRLAVLSENAKKLLMIASICGRVFQYAVLEAVSELKAEDLLDALDELIQKGFIKEEGNERYRFVHNAIYETVLGEIIGIRKKIMHKKIAEVLEGLENRQEYTHEIAKHYYNAMAYDKAAPYALQAAENAARIYAVEDAISYADIAIVCYEKCGNKPVEPALLKGDMLLLSGKYDEALKLYEKVEKIAEQEGWKEKLGIAKARIGIVYHRKGMMNKALEFLLQALEIFEQIDAKREYASTLRSIGWVYERKGEFSKSLDYLLKALKLTEELNEPSELADAYHRLGTTQLSIGLMEEAEKNLRKAIEIRQKHNLLKGLADSYNNLGILYHEMGELDKAIEYYTKAKEIYARIGDVVGVSTLSNNLGIIYHDRGEWEKALENYLKDYHTNLKLGNLWGHMVSASNIGSLYREMERYDEALKYYNEALEYSEKIGEKWIYCTTLANLAEIYAIKGDLEKAKELAERCLMIGKSTGSKDSMASALTSWSIVQRYAKNWSEAEEALTNAKLLYTEMGVKSGIASCDEELGILYSEMGELEKAKRFFEEALEKFKQVGQTKAVERVEKAMKKYGLLHN